MGKQRPKHGPRYLIPGKTKSWATRNKKGQFKDWTGRKQSLAQDKARSAKKGSTPGYGFEKDY